MIRLYVRIAHVIRIPSVLADVEWLWYIPKLSGCSLCQYTRPNPEITVDTSICQYILLQRINMYVVCLVQSGYSWHCLKVCLLSVDDVACLAAAYMLSTGRTGIGTLGMKKSPIRTSHVKIFIFFYIRFIQKVSLLTQSR